MTQPVSAEVYVSITGLTLKGRRHAPRFWWHAIRSMRQARRAAGNLRVDARTIGGVHHTLSVWTDEPAMRAYLVAGAHLQAMRAFRSLATGSTLGFRTTRVPDWEAVGALWAAEAKAI